MLKRYGFGCKLEIAVGYISSLWPVLLAIVGLVSWLVKVNGSTMDNARTIARVERESAASLEKLEIRIEDRRREDMDTLHAMFAEIKQDIRDIRGK